MSAAPRDMPRRPPLRPEYERALEPVASFAAEESPAWRERLWRRAGLRKAVILIVFAILWEIVARWQDNELLLPTFSATI
jgi:NitT/TauT family transport system permease protein